ncbi:hypothetical protein KDA11_06595, partial [Candidatus Saccharibacteria bacterium]|nr:hypothetical protein [Candidatus Saccharibacteria bacterium]
MRFLKTFNNLLVVVLFTVLSVSSVIAAERVSTTSSNTQASDGSWHGDLSSNGRYLVFQSMASNLSSPASPIRAACYLKDLQTSQVYRLPHGLNNPNWWTNCFYPTVSSDGRYVAYVMTEWTPPNYNTYTSSLVMLDRQTNTTEIIATSTIQEAENRPAIGIPAMSDNGRYLAFATKEGVFGFSDSTYSQIYLWDRFGANSRVTTSSTGAAGNNNSNDPDISGDGSYLVYSSRATNIVPASGGSAGNYYNVIARATSGGNNFFVSRATALGAPNGDNLNPKLKGKDYNNDGISDLYTVAFSSAATNIGTTSDSNGQIDIYTNNLVPGSLSTRVSFTANGSSLNAAATEPALSADGLLVGFLSSASNAGFGVPAGRPQAYIINTLTGELTWAS